MMGNQLMYTAPIAQAAAYGVFEYEDIGGGYAKITDYIGTGGQS